jgi:hypothetical protein
VPLAVLEHELGVWAAAQPPADPAKFRLPWLRDVAGLHGGQNVYVQADGTVIVQKIGPAKESAGLPNGVIDGSLPPHSTRRCKICWQNTRPSA